MPQRIMGGTRQIPVSLHDGAAAEMPFRFVPDFPGPADGRDLSAPAGDGAGGYRAASFKGGGRVVYFPWNIGEVFWEVLNLDHSTPDRQRRPLGAGAEPRVEVTGPGVVDIAMREGDGRLAVHLVNLTNPMMMKGPIREVIPVGRQTVSVALPAGAARLRRPATGFGAAYRRRGSTAGRVEIEVPKSPRAKSC